VNTALKKVISNKEYLKSAKGDISPASVASASLTRALLQVGEFNLIRGKGLNGAGARIAGKLEAQLAKKDTDENKVRIRQAIALAMTLAGNQKEMPKITQQSDKGRMLQPVPPRRLTPTEIIRLRIQDDVMRRLNVARRELYPNNRTLTPSQIQGIITRVYAAYRDNDAVLREHAAAYAREFAEPGVLRENGINYEWQTLLILPIVAYFAGDGTDLGTILTNLGVPDANQRAVQNLLRWNNPLDRSNIELLGIRAFGEVMNPNAEIMAGLERLAAGDPAAEQTLLVLRQQLFWYNWPQNYRY
jgi:hypothetical protein